MRVAVCARGISLDSSTDPRFGRCTHFVIVDTETEEAHGFENPGVTAAGGAGIQTAQTLAKAGVKAVLTGNIGPNAIRTLDAAGVEVYSGVSGTVRDAIRCFKDNSLPRAESATVESHFGMGMGGRGRG